jgi:hypothetical protein
MAHTPVVDPRPSGCGRLSIKRRSSESDLDTYFARLGQPRSDRLQRLQTPLELGTLDSICAEGNGPYVRPCRAWGIACAPQHFGTGRVQRLILLEGRIGEQR